jgi:hypothetical protein
LIQLTSSMRVLDLPAHVAIHAAPDTRREDEARLVRQLPKLGRLLREPAHVGLVVRTLEVARGNPRVLELAEAQAGSAERLSAYLERG